MVEAEGAVPVIGQFIDEGAFPSTAELCQEHVEIVASLDALGHHPVRIVHPYASLGGPSGQLLQLLLCVALVVFQPGASVVAPKPVHATVAAGRCCLPHTVVGRLVPCRVVHVVVRIGTVGKHGACGHETVGSVGNGEELESCVVGLRPCLADADDRVLFQFGVGLHLLVEVALETGHRQP